MQILIWKYLTWNWDSIEIDHITRHRKLPDCSWKGPSSHPHIKLLNLDCALAFCSCFCLLLIKDSSYCHFFLSLGLFVFLQPLWKFSVLWCSPHWTICTLPRIKTMSHIMSHQHFYILIPHLAWTLLNECLFVRCSWLHFYRAVVILLFVFKVFLK